jgi:hypothetical protein
MRGDKAILSVYSLVFRHCMVVLLNLVSTILEPISPECLQLLLSIHASIIYYLDIYDELCT